jgi:hypothetical protein
MGQLVYLDEQTHTYTVDGVKKDGVTDQCKIFGDDVDEYIEDAMERAADRGVTCHMVLELALTGEDYSGEYPAMYQPWVDSIETFLAAHEIVPIAIEEPIYSERLDLCGTPDLLCLYDGELAVLDWKFVSSICKQKVKAQLNGYKEIFNDNGVFPEKLVAVQFTKDKPREYEVAIGGDEWETALKVREIRNRKYKRGMIG